MLKHEGQVSENNMALAAPASVEISRNDLLELIANLPQAYVDEGHAPSSLTTIAARVLFERHLQDETAETPTPPDRRGFTLDEFRTMAAARYAKEHGGTEPSRETIENVPHAVAVQLRGFRPTVQVGDHRWKVGTSGPSKPNRTNGEGPADRYYVVIHPESIIESEVLFPHLIGRCFSCGTTYEFDPNERFCRNRACFGNRFPEEEHRNFVTIFPERRLTHGGPAVERLPLESDLVRFALERDAFDPGYDPGLLPPLPHLPFERDWLTEHGFHLGSPIIHELPSFASWSGFRDVLVMDMSPYWPTGTLKDAKSWPVINEALSGNASHLVVYTAGNAGLSLARLAYCANRARNGTLKVIALVGGNLPSAVRWELSTAGCTILPLAAASGAFPIVDTRAVWRIMHSLIDRTSSDEPIPSVHHVTDGWDGYGVGMYRALFAQTLRRVNVDYLVVPAGTGNLLVGAALALRDLAAAGISTKTRLVAAGPYPENIKQACMEHKMPYSRRFRVTTEEDAVMPKLAGTYSPLIPCVSHLLSKNELLFVEVSRTMQNAAATYMASWDRDARILAEPSAFAGFAALVGDGRLPGLREFAQGSEAPSEYRVVPPLDSTVLVVNTGFGVVGDEDHKFLAEAGLK
jgi:hypothetical protein